MDSYKFSKGPNELNGEEALAYAVRGIIFRTEIMAGDAIRWILFQQ